MTDSDSDLKPLGKWALFGLALVRWLDKVGRILIPLVVMAVATFATCRAERAREKVDAVEGQAATKSQETKDLAESGYQVVKHRLEALETWRAAKEAEAVAAAAAARARSRRRPIPVEPVKAPRPLPPTLNAAKAKIEQSAPPSALAPQPVAPATSGKDAL